MDSRNDLLHGNVTVGKLRFNEVYFLGKIPVFKAYRSMWNRSFEVQKESVGLDKVEEELRIVQEFSEHVLSCLDDQIQDPMRQMICAPELGIHKQAGRVGVLFPDHLVDFRAEPRRANGDSGN